MKEFLAITRALSDENRVRAIMSLAGGELCLCHIIELLGLAPSTVSKHMAVLHQAGLVEVRKAGKWIYYRLADGAASRCPRRILDVVRECITNDPGIRDDVGRVRQIRKMSMEKLCCHYRKSVRKK